MLIDPFFITFSTLLRKGCFGRSLASFWHHFGSILIALGTHLAKCWLLLVPFRFKFVQASDLRTSPSFMGLEWNLAVGSVD